MTARPDDPPDDTRGATPGGPPATTPDRDETVDDAGRTRALAFVRGRVQGVGFRWWVRAAALELGLTGHARNLDDGRVEVVAQGPVAAVDALVDALQPQPRGSAAGLPRRPGRVAGTTTHRSLPTAGPDARGFLER